jgi:hypothetical protein
LFAVARGLDPERLRGSTGLRGAPLEVVGHGDLDAVVCDVDLDEFGEEALRANLEDLAWLEEVARGHNDVVWALAEHATVAPMRLVTICADDDSVRGRVEETEEGLLQALDRVEGRSEWSLKVFATPTAEPEPAASTSGVTSGAAYLKQKREAADRRRSAQVDTERLAEEVYAAAAGAAVAGRRLPVQDPRLTARPEPMVLNAAFLVPTGEAEAFVALVRGGGEGRPGISVELQGPWPPYSFAVLEP